MPSTPMIFTANQASGTPSGRHRSRIRHQARTAADIFRSNNGTAQYPRTDFPSAIAQSKAVSPFDASPVSVAAAFRFNVSKGGCASRLACQDRATSASGSAYKPCRVTTFILIRRHVPHDILRPVIRLTRRMIVPHAQIAQRFPADPCAFRHQGKVFAPVVTLILLGGLRIFAQIGHPSDDSFGCELFGAADRKMTQADPIQPG